MFFTTAKETDMIENILTIVNDISESNPYSTVFTGKYLVVDTDVTYSKKYDKYTCKVKAVISTMSRTFYYTLFCYDSTLWEQIEIDRFYFLSGVVSVGSGLFLKILNVSEANNEKT